MNILALDSADEILSIALSAGDGIWYYEIDHGPRHSELMMDSIDLLFRNSGLNREELNLIACMEGPGSFTGLRIGFSTAKGLAMALGIPLVSIPTLDCLAFHLSMWPGIVVPAIDSKKDCFFTALYHNGARLTDYMDVSPESIAKDIENHCKTGQEAVILTGSGAALLKPHIEAYIAPERIYIDKEYRKGCARELLEIAKGANNYSNLNSGPVYLRKSDAELNIK